MPYLVERSERIATQVAPYMIVCDFFSSGVSVPLKGERAQILHVQKIQGKVTLTIPNQEKVPVNSVFAQVIVAGARNLLQQRFGDLE